MKEKGRFLKQYRGNQCLNCNVPLDVIDRYCHNCGQINTTKKLSFKDFFNEFFASIFSYDSRLRYTIVALLFKPGKISRDYIEGKRVTYANPFRFYLSVSIVFFIINGFFMDFEAPTIGIRDGIKITQKETNKIVDSLKQDIREEGIHALDSLRKNLGPNSPINIDTLEETIAEHIVKDSVSNTYDFVSTKKKKEITYYSQKQLDTIGFFDKGIKLWPMYRDFYTNNREKPVIEALSELNHTPNWYNKYLYQRVMKTKDLESNYGKELFEFVFSKLPFIIFFFLPFFALSIWFLYIRRPYTYMEHLVFTFHTQTTFFIFLGLGILINLISKSEAPTGIAILIFLIYLYKAMRKFYKQKRFKTIVKFLLVNILFFILAVIGSVTTIIGSIFLY